MQFSLEHFCEPLMEDPSYFSKRMFGGLAIYFNDLMVLVFMESPGDREWKGVEYDFDIWNGAMICTSREHHESLQQEFSALVSHPVLGKWLYMPMSDIGFESQLQTIVEKIHLSDPRIGIVPGQRKKKNRKKTTKRIKAKKKT